MSGLLFGFLIDLCIDLNRNNWTSVSGSGQICADRYINNWPDLNPY
jgi:hypothetical protein